MTASSHNRKVLGPNNCELRDSFAGRKSSELCPPLSCLRSTLHGATDNHDAHLSDKPHTLGIFVSDRGSLVWSACTRKSYTYIICFNLILFHFLRMENMYYLSFYGSPIDQHSKMGTIKVCKNEVDSNV